MISCPVCKAKLIPVIHGVLNSEMLKLQDEGKILISLEKGSDRPNSFCPICEESYKDHTTMF